MTQHLDLNALQAAAEAAKDWDWRDRSYEEDYSYSDLEIAACRYSAAANPAIVLALIDRLRKAESATVPVEAFDRVMALVESNAARIIELEDRAEAPREGWKLVPIEPTKEMWAAVNKLDDEMAAGSYNGRGCSIEQAWNSLLAAAPDSTPTDSADSEGAKG